MHEVYLETATKGFYCCQNKYTTSLKYKMPKHRSRYQTPNNCVCVNIYEVGARLNQISLQWKYEEHAIFRCNKTVQFQWHCDTGYRHRHIPIYSANLNKWNPCGINECVCVNPNIGQGCFLDCHLLWDLAGLTMGRVQISVQSLGSANFSFTAGWEPDAHYQTSTSIPLNFFSLKNDQLAPMSR